MKESATHTYSKFCLSLKAAALVPSRLLASRNKIAGLKAIIQQLVDQLAARVAELEMAATQAAGLIKFAERVLETPYATTPMRATRCHA